MNFFAVGFTIAFAAFGSAIAQGLASKAALEGMARQPEQAGKLQTAMLIAAALVEGLAFAALFAVN